MAEENRNMGQGNKNVGGQGNIGQKGTSGSQGMGGTTGQTGGQNMAGGRTTGGSSPMGGTTGATGGMSELRREIENVDFPVSKNELVNQVGTRSVNLGGKNINLKEVIQKVPKDRFQSQDELLRELQNLPEMKNIGGGMGGGVGNVGGTTGTGTQRRH